MTFAPLTYRMSAFYEVLQHSEGVSRQTFRLPQDFSGIVSVATSPIYNRMLGVYLTFISTSQLCTLQPITRGLKAIIRPLLDSHAPFSEKSFRALVGFSCNLALTALQVSYAALHIILPEINAILPYKELFASAYFTYKAMQLHDIPFLDGEEEWRDRLIDQCTHEALHSTQKLSLIFKTERIVNILQKTNQIQDLDLGVVKARVQEYLENNPEAFQEISNNSVIRNTQNRVTLYHEHIWLILQPLFPNNQDNLLLDELEDYERIVENDEIHFEDIGVVDAGQEDMALAHIHPLATEGLIHSLLTINNEYVEKNFFTKDDIQMMEKAYLPGLNTATFHFIKNCFSIDENTGKNTISFDGRSFLYDQDVRYPPFSRLCYPECQDLMATIQMNITQLLDHNWSGLDSDIRITDEEVADFITAFLLHGDAESIPHRDIDKEEKIRLERRQNAIKETRIGKILADSQSLGGERAASMKLFLEKTQRLEVSLGEFRRAYFDTLITGSQEWRGRSLNSIQKAFLY